MAACYPTVMSACPTWTDMHSMSESDYDSEDLPSPSPSPDRSVYHVAPTVNTHGVVYRSSMKHVQGRPAPLAIRLITTPTLPPAHQPAQPVSLLADSSASLPQIKAPTNIAAISRGVSGSLATQVEQPAEISQVAQTVPAISDVTTSSPPLLPVSPPPLASLSPLIHASSPQPLAPDSQITDSSGGSTGNKAPQSNTAVSFCTFNGTDLQKQSPPPQEALPLKQQQHQDPNPVPNPSNNISASPSFAPSPRQWRGRRTSPSPSRSLSRSPSPISRSPSPVRRNVRKCYSPTLSPSPAPRSPSPTPLRQSHSTAGVRGRSFSRSPSYMRNSTSPPMAAHDLRGHAPSPSAPPSRSPSPSPIPPPRVRGRTQQQEPRRLQQPQHRRSSSGSDYDRDDARDRRSWESERNERARGISPEDSKHWPVLSAPVERGRSSQQSKQTQEGINGRAGKSSLAGHSRRREIFEEESSLEAERYGKRNSQHQGRSGSVDRRSRSRSRSRWSPPRRRFSRSRSRSPSRSSAAGGGGAGMYSGNAGMFNGGSGYGMMWPMYQQHQQHRGSAPGSSASMMMEDAAWEQNSRDLARQQQQQQPPRPPPRAPRQDPQCTLFCGDLSPDLTSGELSALFEPLVTGRVKARVMAGKCYGFVEFASPEEADKALEHCGPQGPGVFCEPGCRVRASRAEGGLPAWKKGGTGPVGPALMPGWMPPANLPLSLALASLAPLVLNLKGHAGGGAGSMLPLPALIATNPAALLKAHRAAAVAMVAQTGCPRARAVAAVVTSTLAVAAAAFMGQGNRPQLDYSDL